MKSQESSSANNIEYRDRHSYSKQRLHNCIWTFGDVLFGDVLFEIIESSTWETALWALVWFISSVATEVSFQICDLTDTIVA